MRVPSNALVFLVSLLIVGCDSGSSEVIDLSRLSQEPAALVGTWVWERSTSFDTRTGEPLVETPRSTGRTATVTFGSDGSFRESTTGRPERVTTYEVVPVGRNGRELTFGDGGSAAFGTNRHRLVVTTAYRDGPETVYRRR